MNRQLVIYFLCGLNAFGAQEQKAAKHDIIIKQKISCAQCKKSNSEVKSKLKICGKCRKNWYCSEKCQIADWDNHKVTCLESSKYQVLNIVTDVKPIKNIIAGYLGANSWQEIKCVKSEYHGYLPPCMSYSSDGNVLVAAVENSEGIAFWDAHTMARLPNPFSVSRIDQVSFSYDGKYLAVLAKAFNLLGIYCFATGNLNTCGPNDDLREISMLPDSSRIAISTYQNLLIYNWEKLKTELTIQEITGSLCFSKDRKYFCPTTHKSSLVTIWDAKTYKKIKELHLWEKNFGHEKRAIAFSPDGKYFAAGGVRSDTIALYCAETFKLKRILETIGVPWSIVFSHDSNYLLASTGQPNVTVFNLSHFKKIQQVAVGKYSNLTSCPGKEIIAIGLPQEIKIWQEPTYLD